MRDLFARLVARLSAGALLVGALTLVFDGHPTAPWVNRWLLGQDPDPGRTPCAGYSGFSRHHVMIDFREVLLANGFAAFWLVFLLTLAVADRAERGKSSALCSWVAVAAVLAGSSWALGWCQSVYLATGAR